ncbi:hypothetical protein CLOM_g17131 [Closterium sp. NIES-68]|nr:hypothetical protein CLOM_g17131 [Closterium sp. NIES-68]
MDAPAAAAAAAAAAAETAATVSAHTRALPNNISAPHLPAPHVSAPHVPPPPPASMQLAVRASLPMQPKGKLRGNKGADKHTQARAKALEGEEKDKWSKAQRQLREKVDGFIKRMRFVQGDRRFRPWGGSVLDSVIGAFLTQNVSDHASSSAFMLLASRFPPKRANEGKDTTTPSPPKDTTTRNKGEVAAVGDQRAASDFNTAAASVVGATVHATAAFTPHATAASTPHATAASTPHATAASTPHATAASTPHATAASTPHATAASTPHATAASTPHATAASTPHGRAANPAAASAVADTVSPCRQVLRPTHPAMRGSSIQTQGNAGGSAGGDAVTDSLLLDTLCPALLQLSLVDGDLPPPPVAAAAAEAPQKVLFQTAAVDAAETARLCVAGAEERGRKENDPEGAVAVARVRGVEGCGGRDEGEEGRGGTQVGGAWVGRTRQDARRCIVRGERDERGGGARSGNGESERLRPLLEVLSQGQDTPQSSRREQETPDRSKSTWSALEYSARALREEKAGGFKVPAGKKGLQKQNQQQQQQQQQQGVHEWEEMRQQALVRMMREERRRARERREAEEFGLRFEEVPCVQVVEVVEIEEIEEVEEVEGGVEGMEVEGAVELVRGMDGMRGVGGMDGVVAGKDVMGGEEGGLVEGEMGAGMNVTCAVMEGRGDVEECRDARVEGASDSHSTAVAAAAAATATAVASAAAAAVVAPPPHPAGAATAAAAAAGDGDTCVDDCESADHPQAGQITSDGSLPASVMGLSAAWGGGRAVQECVDWHAVSRTDVVTLAGIIADRGMSAMLAGRIKALLNRLETQHGSLSLEWLHALPVRLAQDFLVSIRGMGLKSTECIRLLCLRHLAFPVDTNVGRICVRLGWVPLEPLPHDLQLHLLEQYPVQESLQRYLWPRLCGMTQEMLYELHYHMITFGKVYCTKRSPNCIACPMKDRCQHFNSALNANRPLLASTLQGSATSAGGTAGPRREAQGSANQGVRGRGGLKTDGVEGRRATAGPPAAATTSAAFTAGAAGRAAAVAAAAAAEAAAASHPKIVGILEGAAAGGGGSAAAEAAIGLGWGASAGRSGAKTVRKFRSMTQLLNAQRSQQQPQQQLQQQPQQQPLHRQLSYGISQPGAAVAAGTAGGCSAAFLSGAQAAAPAAAANHCTLAALTAMHDIPAPQIVPRTVGTAQTLVLAPRIQMPMQIQVQTRAQTQRQTHALTPQAHALMQQAHVLTTQAHALTPQAHASTPQAHALTPQAHALTPQAHASTLQAHALTPHAHALTPHEHALTPQAHTKAQAGAEPGGEAEAGLVAEIGRSTRALQNPGHPDRRRFGGVTFESTQNSPPYGHPDRKRFGGETERAAREQEERRGAAGEGEGADGRRWAVLGRCEGLRSTGEMDSSAWLRSGAVPVVEEPASPGGNERHCVTEGMKSAGGDDMRAAGGNGGDRGEGGYGGGGRRSRVIVGEGLKGGDEGGRKGREVDGGYGGAVGADGSNGHVRHAHGAHDVADGDGDYNGGDDAHDGHDTHDGDSNTGQGTSCSGDPSRALVLLPDDVAACMQPPPLKAAQRLRTIHYVYELPDNSPLLQALDPRHPDDRCPYLLALWGPGETLPATPTLPEMARQMAEEKRTQQQQQHKGTQGGSQEVGEKQRRMQLGRGGNAAQGAGGVRGVAETWVSSGVERSREEGAAVKKPQNQQVVIREMTETEVLLERSAPRGAGWEGSCGSGGGGVGGGGCGGGGVGAAAAAAAGTVAKGAGVFNGGMANDEDTVPGTLLIPCRTAMRGSFPLNGTYFQNNEVFADAATSKQPLAVPRSLLWCLPRRFVLCGTSIPSVFKGLTTLQVQSVFWQGYVCIRAFDRTSRAPEPLVPHLHSSPSSKLKASKGSKGSSNGDGNGVQRQSGGSNMVA